MKTSSHRFLLPVILSLLLHSLLLSFSVPQLSLVPQPSPFAATFFLAPHPARTQAKPALEAATDTALETSAAEMDNSVQTGADKRVRMDKATASNPKNASSLSDPNLAITPAAQSEAPVAIAPAESLKLQLPPSASLLFNLRRTDRVGTVATGSAKINWQSDGKRYRMQAESALSAEDISQPLLQIHSTGKIDAHGIAPITTGISRRGKAETAIHFQRDDGTDHYLSYSASTQRDSLLAGVQDNATMLMQLTSIGRGDATQIQAGKDLVMPVAGEKESNLATFTVNALQEIDTGIGRYRAWHIVKSAAPGSYHSTLEIWLAPDLHWYPIQLRSTDSSGNVTTQTIQHINYLPDSFP